MCPQCERYHQLVRFIGFYRIQPHLLGSINNNFGEDSHVSCVSKEDEREEVWEEVTKWIETTIYIQMIMTLQ